MVALHHTTGAAMMADMNLPWPFLIVVLVVCWTTHSATTVKRNCKDWHANNSLLPNGWYAIDPLENNQTVDVYCDIYNGGWIRCVQVSSRCHSFSRFRFSRFSVLQLEAKAAGMQIWLHGQLSRIVRCKDVLRCLSQWQKIFRHSQSVINAACGRW